MVGSAGDGHLNPLHAKKSAYTMTAFGCHLEGEISEARPAEVLRGVASLLRDEGVTLPKLYLADTVGWADPHAVRRRVELVRTLLPECASACTCTTRAGSVSPKPSPR